MKVRWNSASAKRRCSSTQAARSASIGLSPIPEAMPQRREPGVIACCSPATQTSAETTLFSPTEVPATHLRLPCRATTPRAQILITWSSVMAHMSTLSQAICWAQDIFYCKLMLSTISTRSMKPTILFLRLSNSWPHLRSTSRRLVWK